MKLSGLRIATSYFEEYLGFLTEVLELELIELTHFVMRLNFKNNWIEVSRSDESDTRAGLDIDFSLTQKEYEDLVDRLSFYYYRKGRNLFSCIHASDEYFAIQDPDGRSWRFVNHDFNAYQNSVVEHYL
jgi:hypothetical protein